MAFVYEIKNKVNGKLYVGITRTSISRRWSGHKHAAKTKPTYLYTAMRKYGIESFVITPIVECSWEYACEVEIKLIATGQYAYNISIGGEGGGTVPPERRDAWKAKLSEARQGATPFAGHTHTEEAKIKCGQSAAKYWATQETYNASEVCGLSFKEAAATYGISKTHYYRLKRSLSSDQ